MNGHELNILDQPADSSAAAGQAETLLLDISGMHCASCIGHVEAALAGVAGVKTARANLATEQAAVTFARAPVPVEQLQAAIAAAGYTARPSRRRREAKLHVRAQTARASKRPTGAGA